MMLHFALLFNWFDCVDKWDLDIICVKGHAITFLVREYQKSVTFPSQEMAENYHVLYCIA